MIPYQILELSIPHSISCEMLSLRSRIFQVLLPAGVRATANLIASRRASTSVGVERKKRTPKIKEVPQEGVADFVSVPSAVPSVCIRGCPVTIVDSVESADRVLSILEALPRSAVVAWNIEATDVDTKRFHTAGTGGRVLCATCTAYGVDFGNGSTTVFIDAIPVGDESDSDTGDHEETSPVLERFKGYFEDPNRLKTSHSFADDYHVLLRHGISLRGIESDTRYLARLANTALSSWEGVARKQDSLVADVAEDVMPTVSQKGYDLRASAEAFNLTIPVEYTDKKLEKFLKKLNGSKIAHFSSTMRPYWIGRTAECAHLTLDLHDELKDRLKESRWKSEVTGEAELTMWDMATMIHRRLISVLAAVEHTGIGIDRTFLEAVRAKAAGLVDHHTSEFRRICSQMKDPSDPSRLLNPDAHLINPHSTQQLRQLLFGYPSAKPSEWFAYGTKADGKRVPNVATFKLPSGTAEFEIRGIGLRAIKSKMKKKRLSDFSSKGAPSVNQKLLSEFAGKDPEAGVLGRAADEDQLKKFGETYVSQSCAMLHHLLNVGKFQYVLGSFIDPLIEKVVADSRIHPSLSLDTSTGRLVCRKPNLHNPPNASDTLGVRAAFAAAPGNCLVVADYSQLELRILAHVTECESMIASLNAGGDYHSWTAVEMFPHVRAAVDAGTCSVTGAGGLPSVKHLFAAERSKAKAVNFSIAYGKCARSIAEDMDCQLAEAEELLASWYASKPEVARWKSDVVFNARVTKQVESILGRTRDIPHIDKKLWKGRSERAAVNHCIQGSAADIAICAMIQIGESLELKKLGFKLLMQIHDEFILEGPIEGADEAKRILIHLMQSPFQTLSPGYTFRVPLEVDAGVGPNWLVAKP